MTESSSLFSFYFISFSPKTRSTIFPLLSNFIFIGTGLLWNFILLILTVYCNSLPAPVVFWWSLQMLCKYFWTHIRPSLISILTVWHSHAIPEEFFIKVYFEKKSAGEFSIKGDSNTNDKYALSEKALWTMNFDTIIIKIGSKMGKLWAF